MMHEVRNVPKVKGRSIERVVVREQRFVQHSGGVSVRVQIVLKLIQRTANLQQKAQI
jgi:hypothetical protein